MAAGSDQTLRPRLIIDNVTKSHGVGDVAVTWHPSNIMHGRLEISCTTSFEIHETTIFLEGISRNWVSELSGNDIILKISKVENKFLSQAFDIYPSMVESPAIVPGGFHLVIPFEFIISRMIASSGMGSPSHCLHLPPSIELGKVYIDETSGKRFAQPSISYQVRAFATFSMEGQDQILSAETCIPIRIMPHTEELPPTDTKDFPAEFKLQESRTIRWSSLGRSLGTLTISMQEPRALTYHMSSRGAGTEGSLNLEVESTSTSDIYPGLQAMSFTVLSLVRIKTFYSTEAFPQLPSQNLLAVHGAIQLRDDVIKLETQKIPRISWGYAYHMIDGAAQSHRQLLQLESKSKPQLPKGKWMAKISHPIYVDSCLLPTFCSSFVARSYSIILRIKVSGIRKESFDLEVPLQVVHNPLDAQSSEAVQYSEVTGPTEEDVLLSELRRAPATSWFSNEYLENVDLPPRYYP